MKSNLLVAVIASTLSLAAAGTETVVAELVLSESTNIVVAAGDTLKIEYLDSETPVTVTKTGGGRLVLAVVELGTNITVNVEEGVLASCRPAGLPQVGEYPIGMHIDASVDSTLVKSLKNGTNFVSKIKDAAGSGHTLNNWSMGLPYLTGEKLNGLQVLDFGAFSDGKGHSGNAGMLGNNTPSIPLLEYYFVWKDRDDAIDAPLIDGKEFAGPCVFGNDGNVWTRNFGGAGSGYGMYTEQMIGSIKDNMRLDGKKISYTYKVPRGFHVFRNHIDYKEGNYRPLFNTLGYSIPYKGGIVLAEALIYSNRLSTVEGDRVEAYLKSKWFGAGIDVRLAEGATLDVSAVKFDIGTLDVAGNANIIGESNLSCRRLTRASAKIAADDVFAFGGKSSPWIPDLNFDGDAVIEVAATGRVDFVESANSNIVKRGAGMLVVAEPNAEEIKVEAGTLAVSPLSIRRGEYHLDATDPKSVVYSPDKKGPHGEALISRWEDKNDSARAFIPTTWRTPGYDSSRLVRAPYMREEAVNGLPMVDFGTFADVHHPDGWGASLEGSPSFDAAKGLRDILAVWMDYPEVKDYPYQVEGIKNWGPCFFGYEYNWFRGQGGNGTGFPVHYSTCPGGMWLPKNTGLVYVDGAEVSGAGTVIGDGVHVLAQRVHQIGLGGGVYHPGTSLQSLGGAWQASVYVDKDPNNRVKGVFGGCLLGEVLMFRDYLPDDFRMRLSGQLCAKWRNAANIREYTSIDVAAGARLEHPYADLRPEVLKLAGTIAANSVSAGTLEFADGATVEGTLALSGGSTLKLAYDSEAEAFPAAAVASLAVQKGVKLSISGVSPVTGLVNREFRIFELPGASVEAKLTLPSGSGVKAYLTAKADGVYLKFESAGMMMLVK